MEVITLADWDRVMDLNLRGMFIAVKAVLPHMQARKYGRIVLTSSITGPETGIPGIYLALLPVFANPFFKSFQ
jgi:3-oxoacyl-[acyl-carrier protein] reductase